MTRKQGTGPLLKVGLAQYRIGGAPVRMITMALGSCLGIVLFDREAGIGAMAHVMHPNQSKVKNNSNKAKFADTAIELMLHGMVERGAIEDRVVAKIFGGARMFDYGGNGDRGVLQIGEENVKAARAELEARGIPIVAESVGGRRGRTIVFDVSKGSVCVWDIYGNKEIY
jgi:chemotaxis protein CheD